MTFRRKLVTGGVALALLLGAGLITALRLARSPSSVNLTRYIPAGAQELETIRGSNFVAQVFQTTNTIAELEQRYKSAFGLRWGGSFGVMSMNSPVFLRPFIPHRSAGVMSTLDRRGAVDRFFITTTPGQITWVHLSALAANEPARLAMGGHIFPRKKGSSTNQFTASGILGPLAPPNSEMRSGAWATELALQMFSTTNSVTEVEDFYCQLALGAPHILTTWSTNGLAERIALWLKPDRVYVAVISRSPHETNTSVKAAASEPR